MPKAKKEKVVEEKSDAVAVVKPKVENCLAEVSEIYVMSDEDLLRATTVLSNVKKLQKYITQEKEKMIKPLREAMSVERGRWAVIEEQVDQAEARLKRAMIDYQDEKMAEQRRKEESIAKRAEAGQLRPETAVKKMEELGEVKNNVQVEAGSAAFRKVKQVVVIDKDKVPDQYWIIDMTTLRAAALSESKSTGKLGEVIPGVLVQEVTSVASNV